MPGGRDSDDISAAFFLSVTCTESVPFIHLPAARTEALQTFGGDYRLEQQRRAEEVAKHLPNGRHVIVANNGHAFGSLGECGQRLIAAFIAARSAATLDVSCASQIPPTPFVIEKRR